MLQVDVQEGSGVKNEHSIKTAGQSTKQLLQTPPPPPQLLGDLSNKDVYLFFSPLHFSLEQIRMFSFYFIFCLFVLILPLKIHTVYVLEYFQVFISMSVPLYMRIYIHEGSCPQKPEEGIRAHGVGITGGCKLPKMSSKNLIQIFFKSSIHTQPISFPSNSSLSFFLVCLFGFFYVTIYS